MDGESDGVSEMFIPYLRARDMHCEISWSDCPYYQKIALKSLSFKQFSGSKRKVKVTLCKRHFSDNFSFLLECPSEPKPFQTSEGVLLCIVAGNLQLL